LVIKLFSSNYARYPCLKAFDNLMTILFASSFIVVVAAIEIQNAIWNMLSSIQINLFVNYHNMKLITTWIASHLVSLSYFLPSNVPHLAASPRQSFFMKMIGVWVKVDFAFLPHSNINVSVLFKPFVSIKAIYIIYMIYIANWTFGFICWIAANHISYIFISNLEYVLYCTYWYELR